jgi:hypothetical protein
MLGGRAIKALGQTTLDLVESQAIRIRLRTIRILLGQDGRAFASLPIRDQANIVDELDELCWWGKC